MLRQLSRFPCKGNSIDIILPTNHAGAFHCEIFLCPYRQKRISHERFAGMIMLFRKQEKTN